MVRALYESDRQEACVGCCLHIVLDDRNADNVDVSHCLDYARERQHEDCIALAEKLILMSPTQRLKLSYLH